MSSRLGVGISPSAPSGNYTAEYCGSVTQVWDKTAEDYISTYHLLVAGFTVVPTPPTLPLAGNPAFSWQGSVAGVNTGNGSKTTTLPITGWTMRGGMGVSCALYHNSQGLNYVDWGNKWTPSYFSYFTADASGNLTIHWDTGLSYTFTKSGSTYTPPIGILDQLSQTSSATLLTTTNNTVYTFGFIPASGQPGHGNAYLSSITDMDGNTLAINHNSDTTISTVTDANVTGVPSRTLTYAYSGGHLSTITDPLSRVWSFGYGTAGGTSSSNLADVILPTLNDGKTYGIYFGYDGSSNINAMQSAQGRITGATSTFGYDGYSRLLWAKDPVGNKTTFTYNPTNTVITDPNGNTTTHTYSYSRLSSVTDAKGYSTLFNYDVDNILNSTQDKNSVANTLGYLWSNSSHFTNGTTAANGTSTSTSEDPLGYYTSATYDAKNKVTQSGDAVGNVTNNVYSSNTMEDLTSTSVTGAGSSPFKSSSSIGGYANGLPTTFTDALQHQSSVGYDGYGNVNSTIDAAQDPAATAVYNVLGWKTSSTDSNGHTTTTAYDNWGRVTSVTAPDNTQTTMTYDADGNVLTVTDANSHTVTNVYDLDGRLTQTTNGRGDAVKYTYDGPSGYGSADMNGQTQMGLLSSKTDGNGHTTLYTYTVRNEPYQTFYPDSTGESAFYDNNGNLVKRQKSDGSFIAYTYDADNRLTKITYPHLAATSFQYDADGRKTQMTDATGTTSWTYGDGVHLTQAVTPYAGSTQTVTYAYDADGRRSTMGLVGTGTWTYGYDPGGRLTSLLNPYSETTTLFYDAASRLTRQINGDGTYSNFGYDQADQQTDIFYYTSANALLGHLVYGYDPGGNIHTLTQNNTVTTTYGYDGADQLTSETHTGDAVNYALGFTYDKNGNRLTQTSGGNTVQSFQYDAHDKLQSGIGESETYDANGNLKTETVSGQTTSYTYDDEDRLTQIVTPSGTSSFTYNGLGLRTGKTDATGIYAYVCDGTSPGSDVLADGLAVYTPGLSDHRSGASTFSHTDFLGSLRFLTDSGQNVTANLLPDAFGETVLQAGTVATPFGWNGGSGYQSDADGLKLLGHRYYNSRTGRFITQDPAGDGDNWYSYADNSPTNEIDPLGLDGEDGPANQPASPEDGNGQALPPTGYDPDGVPYWQDPTGTTWAYPRGYLHPGGTASTDPGTSSGGIFGEGGLFEGVGGAFGVGLAAVGSAATFHAWNGGVARHDPSFGVSRGLADVGVLAATAAFGGEEAEAANGCFTRGTPVQTQSKAKPIQGIHAGDLVATRNLETNQTEYRKVVRTFQHLAHDTVTVEFADAKTGQVVDTLAATPEHPFYVVGQGMTALGKLGIGTLVVTRAGPSVVVKSLARHHSAAGVTVYNLEVEGDHTYFVGNNGEWVHNDCRSVGELIKDFRANPLNWQLVKTELLPSINRLNKGGTSLQELFRHKETAEELVRHTLFGSDGSIFEASHFRGYWK